MLAKKLDRIVHDFLGEYEGSCHDVQNLEGGWHLWDLVAGFCLAKRLKPEEIISVCVEVCLIFGEPPPKRAKAGRSAYLKSRKKGR